MGDPGHAIRIGRSLLFGGIFGGIFTVSNIWPPTARREKLRASSVAADVLGAPITTGFPFGNINVNGASGNAVPTFSATGPKGSGRVFLEAAERGGVWSIRKMML